MVAELTIDNGIVKPSSYLCSIAKGIIAIRRDLSEIIIQAPVL
uniref:Uncharacterized protein n=1 Tax=Rheinheimera sp. BAL341 TaxID=1708203 RepID=A0A486XQI4_9GAMM